MGARKCSDAGLVRIVRELLKIQFIVMTENNIFAHSFSKRNLCYPKELFQGEIWMVSTHLSSHVYKIIEKHGRVSINCMYVPV